MSTHPTRTVIFPVALERARFYGPHPPTGTRVDCHAVITSLTEDTLLADVRLTLPDGTVWAELSGWRDRRFSGLDARKSGGYPEHRALAEAQPGGWCLLRDAWPDLASRDLLTRMQLGRAEREAYEARPPRGRRQWLLGRIAAKDAVRRWLWEHGEGAVFPAEIEIVNEESGRPRAVGVHGRTLPALDLSLAHRGDLAVALVRPPGHSPYSTGVGIDIEEIADHTPRPTASPSAPANSPFSAGSSPPVRRVRSLVVHPVLGGQGGRRQGGGHRVRRTAARLRSDRSGRRIPHRHRQRPPPPRPLHSRRPHPCRGLDHVCDDPQGEHSVTTSERPPGPAPLAPPDEERVLAEIAGLIVEVLGDYAPDPADIRPETLFGDDLELESIDLVMLSGHLQERYGEQVNFAEFVASLEIDEVIALSVGRLVNHVLHSLGAAPEAGAAPWS